MKSKKFDWQKFEKEAFQASSKSRISRYKSDIFFFNGF